MKPSMKRAFTLIEILIGMGIMVFLTGAFVVFLQGSSRESSYSSEFFTGVLLSQKVVEDITEELCTNPNGFKSLGIQDSETAPTSVSYGQSPYFTYLEDRLPPFGQIDGQGEGNIDPNFGPLFGQTKDFVVTSVARKVPLLPSAPENQHLAKADVQFNWKGKNKANKYLTSALFFAPQGAKPTKLVLAVNPLDIEKEICTRFYRSPTGNLSQLISQYGGDRDTIMAIGTIYVVVNAFLNSPGFKNQMLEYRSKLATLMALSPSDQTDLAYNTRKALAKTSFEIGQSCFQVTCLLASASERLQNRMDQQNLGLVLYTFPTRYEWGLETLGDLYNSFVYGVIVSRNYYRALLDMPQAVARGPREYTSSLNRLIDLHQILTMVPEEVSGMTDYKKFLDDVTSFAQVRNPFLNRFSLQEKSFAQIPATFMEKHPGLSRVQQLTLGSMPTFRAAVLAKLAAVSRPSLPTVSTSVFPPGPPPGNPPAWTPPAGGLDPNPAGNLPARDPLDRSPYDQQNQQQSP